MSSSNQNTRTTYVCSVGGCSKIFSKKLYLDQHIRQHTGERPFHCANEGCGKTYSRKDHLNRHLKWCSASQSAGSRERLTCSENGCSKTFQNLQNLRVHVRNVHEQSKNYKCPVEGCGKVFKKHHGLKQHEFEHSGVNPFSCMLSSCKKSFRVFSHFKRHMKVHDGYKCEHCAETFEKWTQLIKHRSTHHRPLQKCPHCDKVFASKLCLKKHIKVHSETREVFICSRDGCGRYYTMKRNLVAHMKSYHDGRRFPCSNEGCSRSFPFKHKMLEHMKSHSRVHPLKKKYPKKGHRKRSLASRLSGYVPPTATSTCRSKELVSPVLPTDKNSVISKVVTDNINASHSLGTGRTDGPKAPNQPSKVSVISPVSNDVKVADRSCDKGSQEICNADKERTATNLKPPPRDTVIHLASSKPPGSSQIKPTQTTTTAQCCSNTNQDKMNLNSPKEVATEVNKIKPSRTPLPTTNIKFADSGHRQSSSCHKETVITSVTHPQSQDSSTPGYPSQNSVKKPTNKYICSVKSCGKEFVSASSLKIHLFYHTEMQCSASMDSSAKQQMDDILYSTKDCVEVFRSSRPSSKHQPWNNSSNNGGSRSNTSSCISSTSPSHHSSQTPTQTPSQKHQLPSSTATTAQGPTYLHQKLLCSICGDIFFSSSLLSQHLRSHPSAARNSFSCPKPGCGQVFLEKSKLDLHVKDHSSHRSKSHPIFQCPLNDCDMTFKSQSQLKTHANLHSIKKYSKSKQKLAKIILGKYF
ncbi:zinc finger protein ZXDC isoform X2 [Octopus sinensis]|uniref:Zinc finger protein ZXDC isoform X2 n=1 Tax=Octopus sinensis TaxID=2607531 RepID=A0A7E6FTY2_9MOLL|nr:zinc finger protein ZXDC isoform X2 [Octopus sinensis]